MVRLAVRAPSDPRTDVRGRAGLRLVLTMLGCVAVAFAATFLTGPLREPLFLTSFSLVAATAVLGTAYGAWRWRRRLGPAGPLLTAAVLFECIGDAGMAIRAGTPGEVMFPTWSDPLYLSAYVAMISAGLVMIRRREVRRDVAALIDASIITVGVGVVAYCFLIAEAAADTEATLLARLVVVSYPVCDVLLIGVLARMAVGSAGWSRPVVLLAAGIVALLVADLGFTSVVLDTGPEGYDRWISATYLCFYLLVACSLHVPDTGRLGRDPALRSQVMSRLRLGALGLAAMLAPATLLATSVAGDAGKVRGAAIGAAVLFLLAMLRMTQLIRAVELKSNLLAVLARTDGLTGLPNRRTFDFEVERAAAAARKSPALDPLSLAMMDLDHFKVFNDTYGHGAGDQLLQRAATIWSAELATLAPEATIARYGGEEFAVVLPGTDQASAVKVLQALLVITPLGQSFSAGVAEAADGEDGASVVARADGRLYDAKSAGRARVLGAALSPDGEADEDTPGAAGSSVAVPAA